VSAVKTFLVVLLAATAMLPAPFAAAQTSDELGALRKEIEALKEGQERLRKDVQEIRTLLQGARAAPVAPQPQNVVLTLDGDPVKGDRSARLVLVEFTDYQCPFCARHVRDTVPQIEAEYIKTGKLRYVAREFPLEAIHPQAFKASEAALCAGDQGKYWEMHARLFANQRSLAPAELPNHAQAIGLDGAKFTKCLEGGAKAAKVRKDLADGGRAGVTGTPAFFLGVADGSTLKVMRMIRGAQPFASFKEAIESALAQAPAK
jgi:protein-disulfide isomerase